MGRAKEAEILADENWEAKAASEGWRCVICGSVPPRSEKDVYFETKMCGYCNHTANKDD